MLKLTKIKTTEVYKYKYITIINGMKFEIVSNFDEETFVMVLKALKEQGEKRIRNFKVIDCIEFFYTNEGYHITLDVLVNYI